MELSQKGSHVSISEFNRLKVELVWTSAVDLDLLVFYKTLDGEVGGIYSENYQGGSLGSLEKAPFIALSGDAGVGGSGGDNREVVHIARLDHFEQLCVCALNFTDASTGQDRVFADYDARVQVTTDKGEAFGVTLDSSQPGQVAMICKLLPTFLGSDLINTSEVMSLARLRTVAPGAKEFEAIEAGVSALTGATPQRRVLGPLSAMSVIASSMLGIGIFLTPPIAAGRLASRALFFTLWIVVGVAAIAGAVAYAELGAMMPEAGGDYVFLKAAFGPSWAFACGWVVFGAVFTGSIAAMAVPLCEYQLPVLLGPWASFDPAAPVLPGVSMAQAVALGVIVSITGINAVGAKLSAQVQNLTTVVPVALFAIGAVVAVIVAPEPAAPVAPISPPALTAAAVVASYTAIYFAYSGWNAVIYVAGEVENPGRNIPLGLVGGTAIIGVLYLLLCWAFVEILGYGGLAGAGEAGTAAARAVGGDGLAWWVTLLIAFGLLGTINGTVLGGARVAYAMALGGAFWSGASKLSERTGAPVRALWIQAAGACVFVLTGTFEELLGLVSAAMIVIGAITVASVFALRRKWPDRARPYRATGYPWFPGLYLLASAIVAVVMLVEALTADKAGAWFPLVGLGILVAAFAVHKLAVARRAP